MRKCIRLFVTRNFLRAPESFYSVSFIVYSGIDGHFVKSLKCPDVRKNWGAAQHCSPTNYSFISTEDCFRRSGCSRAAQTGEDTATVLENWARRQTVCCF